jgi:hypothetical protein
MSANRKWENWKIATVVGLSLLLAADIGLCIFLWQTSRQAPGELRAQRDRLMGQAKLLRADVARGEKIRASLPQVGEDSDNFYRESFLDEKTGYSDVELDLAAIAAKAGVKTSGFSFKRTEIKGRGVTEIEIGTTVDADYPAIVEFINGLERSKNFYMLDDLRLNSAAASTGGGIRLELGLHTFFRT